MEEIEIELSADEYAACLACAAGAGVTLQEWLRAAVAGYLGAL